MPVLSNECVTDKNQQPQRLEAKLTFAAFCSFYLFIFLIFINLLLFINLLRPLVNFASHQPSRKP